MTPPSSNGTAAAPLARNEYREGQVLRARDLERESGYFLARDRQHAAVSHIPGIVRGLALRAFERGTESAVLPQDLTESKPLDLFLEAGVAVDGYGRLVSVPRREQLRAELATSPSLLRGGRYRVELLYDRAVVAGGGGSGGDPCAGVSPGAAGGRTVREGYRLRLVENDRELEQPAIGAVLDGPPDAPEAEAPVVLGTVDWDGEDAFVGFSLQGRMYAGVRAEVVAAPDRRAELDLRDDAGRVAVRFAPEPAAGEEPDFSEAVTIDAQGEVWVRRDVDVGPAGIRFRTDPGGQARGGWEIALHEEEGGGSSFGRKPGKTPGTEDKADPPPAYFPGELEMRIVFERGDKRGKRRVVVGHVDQAGAFLPSVIVYDRAPPNPHEGSSLVEVWGDLFVRGTAYLSGVQRVPPGEAPSDEDQLNVLLRQLAGPLAGIFRNFLTSDPEWLGKFATIVTDQLFLNATFVERIAQKLGEGTALEALASGVVNRIAADGGLAQKVADAVAGRLQATPSTAQLVADAVAGRIQATPATAATVATAVAGQIQATPATAATVATAVAAQIQATPATALVVANAVAAQAQANIATAQTIATAVAGRIQATAATALTVADAVAEQIRITPATALVVANAVAAQAQANPTTTAQTLATAVAGRIQATPATALTVANAVAEQIRIAPATALVVANAVAAQAQANPTTAQTLATAVAGRIQATAATALTVADAVAEQIRITPPTALVVANAVAAQVQANTTTAQTIATAVAGRVQATTGTAQQVTDAVTSRIHDELPRRNALRVALGLSPLAAGPAAPSA